MAARLAWLVKMIFSDLASPAGALAEWAGRWQGFAQAGNRYPLFGIVLGALSAGGRSSRARRAGTMRRSLFAFLVYLHSWAVRSRACATPLSEKVSVDCVPLAETPLITALSPPRMASTILASSVAFLIQAPSC